MVIVPRLFGVRVEILLLPAFFLENLSATYSSHWCLALNVQRFPNLGHNLCENDKSAKRGHCTRAEQECCIMTDKKQYKTPSAKTLKLFNVYSSLGL